IIDLLRRANIHIMALPATDIYLGGCRDVCNQRQTLTPIRALRAAGMNVTYASNNIQNAFTPFSPADPLQMGLILTHVTQMNSPKDQAEVLRIGTYGAADAISISSQYGIEVKRQADLVILNTHRVSGALLETP